MTKLALAMVLWLAACDGDPGIASLGDAGDEVGGSGGVGGDDAGDPNMRGHDGPRGMEGGSGGGGGGGVDAGMEAELGVDAGMPETFSGTCDPIRQLGCGAGEACDRTCGTASGLGCRPVSPYAGAQKAPCSTAGDSVCAPGYSCIIISPGGPGQTTYCTKLCMTDVDCPSTAIHCRPVRCSWTDKTGPYVTSMCSPF